MNLKLYRKETYKLLAKCCSLDLPFIAAAIEEIRNSKNGGYSSIRIPKFSGGFRQINEPGVALKAVQSALKVFFYCWPSDQRMYGGKPGGSPVANARFHVFSDNQDQEDKKRGIPVKIFHFDLKDAFPSVKADLLKRLYENMFRKEKLADYQGWKAYKVDIIYREFIRLMLELTTYRGCLPQGAPTSPYLLNLALTFLGLPEKIAAVCRTHLGSDVRISFYVDDITISTNKKKPSKTFLREVAKAVESSEFFRLNPEKTRINDRQRKAHKITGVVLTKGYRNRPKLTLPQKTLKTYRGVIHRATVELSRPYLPGMGIEFPAVSLALGYIGWIKSVYQGSEMPASIKQVVAEFEAAYDALSQEKRREKLRQHRQLLEIIRRNIFTI